LKKEHNSIANLIKKHSLISALLIGLLGSALWEWIVSPLSTVFFDYVLSLSGKLSIVISNVIYREISYGYHEQSSDLLLCLCISLLTSSNFLLCIDSQSIYSSSLTDLRLMNRPLITDSEGFPIDNSQNDPLADQDDSFIAPDHQQNFYGPIDDPYSIKKYVEDQFSHSKRLRTICFGFLLPFSILLIVGMMQITYVNKTIATLTNNIEIISPYISDLEYKKLKSSFHMMDSREDYDLLCDSLNEIAVKNQIQLKK